MCCNGKVGGLVSFGTAGDANLNPGGQALAWLSGLLDRCHALDKYVSHPVVTPRRELCDRVTV